MKALVGAFNQEKALVGAFSVIVLPVVEPMEHYTALVPTHLYSTYTVVIVEVVRGRQIATVTTAPSSCAVHTTRAPAFHLQTDRWYTLEWRNKT